LKARRAVLASERRSGRESEPFEEEEIARQARSLAERLAANQRELTRLLEQARSLELARAGRAEPVAGLAVILPQMGRALASANLSLEETWVALEDAFSTEGLARAIKRVRRAAKSSDSLGPLRRRRSAGTCGEPGRSARAQ